MKKGFMGLGMAFFLLFVGGNGVNHLEIKQAKAQDCPLGQGLKKATNPPFKVGSHVVLKANHMPGMKGASATVVAAYETNVYSVSYLPTTGAPEVQNHKWVIQQELRCAGKQLYPPGTKVILEANHMPGMKGARAIIDSGQHTTAYMVDYLPTTGGPEIKNHKWVIGSEIETK